MKNLKLTEELRKEFKKPLGKLMKEIDFGLIEGKTVISVGDEVSENLLKRNFAPKLCIYDKKNKRNPFDPENTEKFKAVQFKAENPQGTITGKSVEIIKEALKSDHAKIFVEGEEDLLVIPAINLAPIGSVVIYGQPNEGVVYVEVDELIKERMKNLIEKFEEI